MNTTIERPRSSRECSESLLPTRPSAFIPRLPGFCRSQIAHWFMSACAETSSPACTLHLVREKANNILSIPDGPFCMEAKRGARHLLRVLQTDQGRRLALETSAQIIEDREGGTR